MSFTRGNTLDYGRLQVTDVSGSPHAGHMACSLYPGLALVKLNSWGDLGRVNGIFWYAATQNVCGFITGDNFMRAVADDLFTLGVEVAAPVLKYRHPALEANTTDPVDKAIGPFGWSSSPKGIFHNQLMEWDVDVDQNPAHSVRLANAQVWGVATSGSGFGLCSVLNREYGLASALYPWNSEFQDSSGTPNMGPYMPRIAQMNDWLPTIDGSYGFMRKNVKIGPLGPIFASHKQAFMTSFDPGEAEDVYSSCYDQAVAEVATKRTEFGVPVFLLPGKTSWEVCVSPGGRIAVPTAHRFRRYSANPELLFSSDGTPTWENDAIARVAAYTGLYPQGNTINVPSFEGGKTLANFFRGHEDGQDSLMTFSTFVQSFAGMKIGDTTITCGQAFSGLFPSLEAGITPYGGANTFDINTSLRRVDHHSRSVWRSLNKQQMITGKVAPGTPGFPSGSLDASGVAQSGQNVQANDPSSNLETTKSAYGSYVDAVVAFSVRVDELVRAEMSE